MFLSVFCRKPCKYCCFCNIFVGFGHFAENLVNIVVFDRGHGPSMKPITEPAGIRVSTFRFPFPRSHSLENPSTKGCGKKKILKSKSVLPKMSARSGLAGERTSRPHLGPPQAIFCVGRKNQKNVKILLIFLGGPMGPIHPVWGPANRLGYKL